MANRPFRHTGLNVDRLQMKNLLAGNVPGGTYYVSRNRGSVSGDGTSWDEAYLTITEAVTAVNLAYSTAAYPTRGRNTLILIDEGWYNEVGMTVTASDCTIAAVSPGSSTADGTVLYGSSIAGSWNALSATPVFRITGSSVSVLGLGFVNSSTNAQPCVVVGTQGSSGPVNNLFDGCFWPRDIQNAYTIGLEDLSNEGTVIKNCYFSQSASLTGVKIASNGVTNPVNNKIIGCDFVGTTTGIHQTAGHNTKISGNWFYDATDDRASAITNPLNLVATSAFVSGNVALSNSQAEFDASSTGTVIKVGNFCSDSDNADWPQSP